MVREFQSVIGREARAQILAQAGRLPTAIVACVGRRQQCHRDVRRVRRRSGRAADRRRGRRPRHHAGPARGALRRRQRRHPAGHAHLRAAGRGREHRARRTRSPPDSITPPSGPSTRGCAISGAPSTPGSTIAPRSMPSRTSPGWRASCRRSSRRTRSRTAERLAADLGPDDIILVNLSGRGDKDLQSVARALEARPMTVTRTERGAAPARGSRARLPTSKASGRTGLVTYVTAGDPDLAHSRAGAARARARRRRRARGRRAVLRSARRRSRHPARDRAGTGRAAPRLPDVLDLVASVRADIAAPIVLFTYANPIVRMGIREFAARAAAAGVDGVLTLDLPIEEAGDVRNRLHEAGLDTIFLLSPTTTTERIRRAAALGSGFLYGISRLGVTGARQTVASGAEALVARIRGGDDAADRGRLRDLAAGARRRGGAMGRCRRRRKRAGQRHRRARRVADARPGRRDLHPLAEGRRRPDAGRTRGSGLP